MGVKYDPTTGLPSNEETNYNKLLEMWREEKKRRQEVEGENTIIKGIGNNSPEMRALQARVKEAQEINKLHQELNGKLQARLTEVEEDNKKLSKQIEDKENVVHKLREKGLM